MRRDTHRPAILLAVACATGVACVQQGTREAPTPPESAETWAVSDTGTSDDPATETEDGGEQDSFAEICEKIDAYDEKHAEIDKTAAEPRVEPADQYDGLPEDVDEVVLHTLDESIATHEEWADLVVRKGGHIDDTVRGIPGPLRPSKLDISGEISPLQKLADILESCDVDRGLFQDLPGPMVAGDRLHLFECAPGMPPLSENVPMERTMLLESLQAAWRVDDILVKCAYPKMHVEFVGDGSSPPPEDFPNAEDFSDAEFVPERIKAWAREIIEQTKKRMRRNLNKGPLPEEEWPHDYYSLARRTFVVEALGSVWRTNRIVLYQSIVPCSDPAANPYCDIVEDIRWTHPAIYRHWKYRFRDDPK